jgi:hypothetical protein
MKKLLTIAFALLLGTTLSVAQASGGAASTDKPASTDTNKKASKKKAKKSKKEKTKKGSTDAAAPEKK